MSGKKRDKRELRRVNRFHINIPEVLWRDLERVIEYLNWEQGRLNERKRFTRTEVILGLLEQYLYGGVGKKHLEGWEGVFGEVYRREMAERFARRLEERAIDEDDM